MAPLVTLRRFLSRARAQRALCDTAGRRHRYRNKIWTAVELLEDRTLLHGTPTNDAPVAQDTTVSTPRNEPVTVDLWALASDKETPDSQLRFEIVSDIGGQAVLQPDGHTVVFTPDSQSEGQTKFIYRVTDTGDGPGAPKSDTGTVNVNLLAPYQANNDEYSTSEDESIDLDVRDNDSVPYGPSRIVQVTQPENGDVEIIGNGNKLRFTPDEDFNGDQTFTYTIEDDRGVQSTATVTLHVRPVNDEPDAGDAQYTVSQNESLSIDLRELVSDKETPDDELQFRIESDQGGEAVLQEDGYTVIFTPDGDYHGPANFKYKVTDTGDGSSPPDSEYAEVSIHVVAPYVANDDTTYVDEDRATKIDVLKNDSVPFEPVRIVSVTDPEGGSVEIVDDGRKVLFTPDENVTGWTSFEYTIRDSRGQEQTATSYIHINPVNDAPVLETNAGLTVDEGGEAPITSEALRTSDVDDGPEQIVYTIVSGPSHGQLYLDPDEGDGERGGGQPIPLGTGATFTQADLDAGRVRYVHDGSETTSDGFEFCVSDGDRSRDGAFEITINPVNDPPVLETNRGLTVGEGTSAAITSEELKTTDADQLPGQIVYTVTASPAHGTIVVDPADDDEGGPGASFASRDGEEAPLTFTQADLDAGRVHYVHDGSETTSDSFTFTVSDGEGGSTQGTFLITVRPVNDAPTTTPATIYIRQTQTATVDLNDLTDDVETPDDLRFVLCSETGGHAVLQEDGHTVVFTPDPDFAGEASFTYRVIDSGDGTNGPASTEGEVLVVVLRYQDFGDAPDTYGTTFENDGARHQGHVDGSNGPYLGSGAAYGESDGQAGPGANGDDTDGVDDEDGVHVITGLQTSTRSDGATIIEVTSSGEAKLDAWIDFNGDGDFDPEERLFDESVTLHEGVNRFVITVPEDSVTGTTYARFRVSTAGDLGPTGLAADGEVEDYKVTITDIGTFEFVDGEALLIATDGFGQLPPPETVPDGTKEMQTYDVYSLPPGSNEEQINQTMLELAKYYETQRKPGETIIIVAVDPVDFVATDPNGRSAGTVNGATSNGYGSSAAYSGDGAVEVLVIRDATPGQYQMDFTGTGAEFRGGVAVVGPSGTETAVFTGALGAGEQVSLSLDFSSPVSDTVSDTGVLLSGERLASATENTGFFLFNVEDEVNPMLDEDEAKQVAFDADDSASIRPGSASEEMRRMFRLSFDTIKAVRLTTIDQLTFETLGDETQELVDQFWMGLGNSIMGGIPSQVYNLAEFMGTEMPRLFDPAAPSESAPVKADAAQPEAGQAAEEGAATDAPASEVQVAHAAQAPAAAIATVELNRSRKRTEGGSGKK